MLIIACNIYVFLSSIYCLFVNFRLMFSLRMTGVTIVKDSCNLLGHVDLSSVIPVKTLKGE